MALEEIVAKGRTSHLGNGKKTNLRGNICRQRKGWKKEEKKEKEKIKMEEVERLLES